MEILKLDPLSRETFQLYRDNEIVAAHKSLIEILNALENDFVDIEIAELRQEATSRLLLDVIFGGSNNSGSFWSHSKRCPWMILAHPLGSLQSSSRPFSPESPRSTTKLTKSKGYFFPAVLTLQTLVSVEDQSQDQRFILHELAYKLARLAQERDRKRLNQELLELHKAAETSELEGGIGKMLFRGKNYLTKGKHDIVF